LGQAAVVAYFFPGKYSSRDISNNLARDFVSIYRINVHVQNSQTRYITGSAWHEKMLQKSQSFMSQAFAQTRFVFTEVQLTLTRYQGRKRINVDVYVKRPVSSRKLQCCGNSREALHLAYTVSTFSPCHSR